MTESESTAKKTLSLPKKNTAQSRVKPSKSERPHLQQTSTQRNNPLHGLSLKTIVTELHEYYGWKGLFEKTKMNCFNSNPSLKSSLTFLRKTPWARDKIEQLYLFTQREIIRNRKTKREL